MFTTFRGGQSGNWLVTSIAGVKGETLAHVPALSVTAQPRRSRCRCCRRRPPGGWPASQHPLRRAAEKEQLDAAQAGLGRPEATQRGADPDPEIAGVVGADAGRAAADLRGQVAPIASSLKYLPRSRASSITAAISASPSIS